MVDDEMPEVTEDWFRKAKLKFKVAVVLFNYAQNYEHCSEVLGVYKNEDDLKVAQAATQWSGHEGYTTTTFHVIDEYSLLINFPKGVLGG